MVAYLLVVVVMLVLAGVAAAPVAWAHGNEANEPARDLVLTAVAVLEAHPSGIDLVEDKINDALESTEPGDVDLDLVREARDTLAAGDLQQTTLLPSRGASEDPAIPRRPSRSSVTGLSSRWRDGLISGSRFGVVPRRT